MQVGRPSSYNMETAERICRLISEGRSLVSICSEEDGMPDRTTVGRWLDKNEAFRIMYARARELQADAMFDKIQEVIDTPAGVVATEFGSHVDSGEVQHRRLKVDALKWMASKLRPKKYGDLTQVQGDVSVRQYVVALPTRTTNDPAEWARQVKAERVASGELDALPAPEDGQAESEEGDPEFVAPVPPPSLPQRRTGGS